MSRAISSPYNACSERMVYSNAKDFTDYITKTGLEYNNPVNTRFAGQQEKE